MSPTPTITDLSRALNLSISSVSDALNGQKGVSEATRRRVLEYAARVGYVPNSAARALSRSRVGAIGVVIRENYSVIRTEPRTTCAFSQASIRRFRGTAFCSS